MKKIKKLLAMIMAMTMVLGMAISVSAAPSTEKGTATVKGVTEEDAVVTAYQMVTYDDTGVYSVVSALNGIYEVGKADADVITSIASNSDLLAQLDSTTLDKQPSGDYIAKLTAGTYLVLVSNTGETVYNPMLLSLNVSYPNGVGNGEVDADQNYVVDGATIYAKSTSVPLEKWISDAEGNKIGSDKENTLNGGKFDTVSKGDIVHFTIKTMIPSYSKQYENDKLTFTLTDTVDDRLKLDNTDDKLVNSIKSQIDSQNLNAAEVKVVGQTITITFDNDYILNNQKKEIQIIYPAVMQGKDSHMGTDAFEGAENKVVLEYSNSPTTTVDKEASTIHFSPDFAIYKIDEKDKDKATADKEYLDGAVFTLTSVDDPNKVFTSIESEDSNEDTIYVFGDVGPGEYTLKETKAPNGYALSNVEYKVTVGELKYNTAGLNYFNVKVYDQTGKEIDKVSYTYNGGIRPNVIKNGRIEILNTQLASLPSTGGIGTTIFTIGGCAIMIAAAALYFVNRRKSEEN